MGDSNSHASDPLPIVAAGGGVGQGNRHVRVATRTPVGDLWMAVAGKFGKRMDRFGDGTETAHGLF